MLHDVSVLLQESLTLMVVMNSDVLRWLVACSMRCTTFIM